jgi:hypothetical protein
MVTIPQCNYAFAFEGLRKNARSNALLVNSRTTKYGPAQARSGFVNRFGVTLWHWTNRPQLALGQMQVQGDSTLSNRAARYICFNVWACRFGSAPRVVV